MSDQEVEREQRNEKDGGVGGREEEIDHPIKEEDIERARLLVGLDAPHSRREFYTTATPDAIRNFARGYGDDNPLFVDPEYGPTTRWGGQIAPPMMASALADPLLGDPIPEDIRQATKGLFSGVHVFVSGQSTEWYRPIYPMDKLYHFGGLESVDVKESEFAGRSVIRILRNVRMNQRADVISVSRTILIATERKKAREKGKYSSIEPASYSEEEIAALDEIYSQEGARGSEPRYWEDVEIGEALPRMAKGPLTLTEVICFHAGGYGFAPYNISSSRIGYKNRQRIPKFYPRNARGIPDVAQRVHWEDEFAQKIGNPMAYDYGVMRECWLTHYLTDWIGDDGWLSRQHDEMRKFNYLGDAHIIEGEVVDKRKDGTQCAVDLDFRAINQRGDVTAPATASVLLPSREEGPALLPEVPSELQKKAVQMMRRHGELQRT